MYFLLKMGKVLRLETSTGYTWCNLGYVCADRAMPWLFDRAKNDLENIYDGISIRSAICPCIDRFTSVIYPGDLKELTLISARFGANIIPGIQPSGRSFVPNHSAAEGCEHDLTSKFDFIIDICDRDRFIPDKPMLIYNAKVQTGYDFLTVDLRDEKSGFLDWNSPENFQERNLHCGTVIRVAEIFSGAFSGWSQSVAAIDQQGIQMQHVWSIDHDFRVAESYGKTHGSRVVMTCSEARRHVELSRRFFQDPKMIFMTDVRNGWFLKHVDRHLHLLMMSPPCQPFSLASSAEGFNREDGRTLAWAWGLTSVIRPKIVCLEEVANFELHPDFRMFLDIVEWAGYHIVSKMSLNLGDILPQNRNRFVLIAVDKTAHDVSMEITWLMWPKIVGQTLRSSRCFLELDSETLKKYQPDADTLQQYLDPRNLPRDPRENPRKRTKIDARKYRIRTWDDSHFSCIMANYSRGHLLPKHVVEAGGIYGALFMQDGVIRFLTPVEICLVMGGIQEIILPSDHAEQMKLLGNAIAVPHALTTILNGLALLKVVPEDLDVGLMFSQIMNKKMRCNTVAWEDDGSFLRIFKREEDFLDLALTQPMKAFVPMIIKAPTTEVFCEVEQGLLIGQTLHLMTGESCPNVVEQEVGGGFRLPIVANDRVEANPVVLHVGVPSILALCDDDFTICDSSAIRILTPRGPIVMKQEGDIQIGTVLKILADFFPEVVALGGTACTGLGEPLKLDEACPNCFIYVDPIPSQILELDHLSGKSFCEVGRQLEMKGHLDDLQRLVQTLVDLGILSACQCLGWTFQIRPECCGKLINYKLVLSTIGERLSIPFGNIVAFLHTRLMIAFIPHCIPRHEEGNLIMVKLWNKWIWKGRLPHHVCLQTLIKPWQMATSFFGKPSDLRMVIRGKNVPHDLLVGDVVVGDHDLKIFLVLPLHGGGNKEDATLKCRSDLAIVMLQHGADVHQASSFVDTVVRSAGIQTVSQIMKLSTGDAKIDALKKLSHTLHIQWPDRIRSDDKRNAKVQNTVKQKGLKAIANISADQFSLVTDGFQNEDKSTPVIRNNIVPGATGLVLMDPHNAKHWVQSQKVISSDELALLVLGHDCPADDTRTCQKVQVAAMTADNRPVVLAACMHNLGQKKISYGLHNPATVETHDTVTVAFTVFRDEFGLVDWGSFIKASISPFSKAA